MTPQLATLDPLDLDKRERPWPLTLANYGFSDADLDRPIYVGNWNMGGYLSQGAETRTLREVVNQMEFTYCRRTGYEYMHINNREICNWLRDKIEFDTVKPFPKGKKINTLDRLTWSTEFEAFLANKYTAAKRFGLEGGESLIPGMKALIDVLADHGAETVVVGMPHRGRLNVLANVFRKPLAQIFAEFSGSTGPVDDDGEEHYSGSGDVKYHLGTSHDRQTLSGKPIHLSLLANPSHLEAVAPVVIGKVRAKQYYKKDETREKVVPIILHGDGSHAGQGVVYETYDMSGLPEYTAGGSIHIVVNNQVAFTTDPKFSRSSDYCTDGAKSLECPVFHVNGDDVEAVCETMALAAEFRQKFKKDVVIDMVCYRKFGHNEIDEPMFTQPLMYKAIKKHRSALDIYRERLVSEGSLTKEEVKKVTDDCAALLNTAYEEGKTYVHRDRDWLSSHWEGFKGPDQISRIRNTGVPHDVLQSLGMKATTLPDDFSAHKNVKKVYANRQKMIKTGEGVDWATAEALAFATLLSEGNHVRLSGQDVERGTFTHRHAVLHDQKTGERYCPLDNLYYGQVDQQFTVSNSALSEFGVLGFELGYSLQSPDSLVLWEAQFGDFANGAQVIFDQFLSSGEAKWLRQCGLVCLLPHGYDGQGPEHSSARLERYLQMCDDDPFTIPEGALSPDARKWSSGGHLGGQIQNANWQIANVTTPANYFHLLRRQIHRQFRKPLIVMAPKNLLRHPKCKSPLSDFDDEEQVGDRQGVRFKRLIMDDGANDIHFQPEVQGDVKKLVLCSGKVYYDLHAEREARGIEKDVALVRVEQISPFPYDLVMREMRRYPNASVQWCQEEHKNMGAYSYVMPRIETCMRALDKPVDGPLPYAGRVTSASTATGFKPVHDKEQADLVNEALTV